jgi:hypothetical protein
VIDVALSTSPAATAPAPPLTTSSAPGGADGPSGRSPNARSIAKATATSAGDALRWTTDRATQMRSSPQHTMKRVVRGQAPQQGDPRRHRGVRLERADDERARVGGVHGPPRRRRAPDRRQRETPRLRACNEPEEVQCGEAGERGRGHSADRRE